LAPTLSVALRGSLRSHLRMTGKVNRGDMLRLHRQIIMLPRRHLDLLALEHRQRGPDCAELLLIKTTDFFATASHQRKVFEQAPHVF
jgi:hypothetical protein